LIVLDASALLELVLSTSAGKQLAQRLDSPRESLHAPHITDLEILNALRRELRAGRIDAVRATNALHFLANLDLERHSHEPMIRRIWELKDNLSAYDAAYVALAEILDCPLLTADARLSHAPGARCTVELLGAP
jgi:predicted nucleic acid-binding protein